MNIHLIKINKMEKVTEQLLLDLGCTPKSTLEDWIYEIPGCEEFVFVLIDDEDMYTCDLCEYDEMDGPLPVFQRLNPSQVKECFEKIKDGDLRLMNREENRARRKQQLELYRQEQLKESLNKTE